MSWLTLGHGSEAVRLTFTGEGVEVRTSNVVINGNTDVGAALRWVLDHPGADAPSTALGEGCTTENLVGLLEQLADAGIPADVWGDAWLGQVRRRSGR
jgi:hypothetical protein